MKKMTPEKVAEMETELQQAKALLRRQNARLKAEQNERARKLDTRRKILIGAAVLGLVQKGQISQAQLNKWLDDGLTKPDDRAAFDLSPSKA